MGVQRPEAGRYVTLPYGVQRLILKEQHEPVVKGRPYFRYRLTREVFAEIDTGDDRPDGGGQWLNVHRCEISTRVALAAVAAPAASKGRLEASEGITACDYRARGPAP